MPITRKLVVNNSTANRAAGEELIALAGERLALLSDDAPHDLEVSFDSPDSARHPLRPGMVITTSFSSVWVFHGLTSAPIAPLIFAAYQAHENIAQFTPPRPRWNVAVSQTRTGSSDAQSPHLNTLDTEYLEETVAGYRILAYRIEVTGDAAVPGGNPTWRAGLTDGGIVPASGAPYLHPVRIPAAAGAGGVLYDSGRVDLGPEGALMSDPYFYCEGDLTTGRVKFTVWAQRLASRAERVVTPPADLISIRITERLPLVSGDAPAGGGSVDLATPGVQLDFLANSLGDYNGGAGIAPWVTWPLQLATAVPGTWDIARCGGGSGVTIATLQAAVPGIRAAHGTKRNIAVVQECVNQWAANKAGGMANAAALADVQSRTASLVAALQAKGRTVAVVKATPSGFEGTYNAQCLTQFNTWLDGGGSGAEIVVDLPARMLTTGGPGGGGGDLVLYRTDDGTNTHFESTGHTVVGNAVLAAIEGHYAWTSPNRANVVTVTGGSAVSQGRSLPLAASTDSAAYVSLGTASRTFVAIGAEVPADRRVLLTENMWSHDENDSTIPPLANKGYLYGAVVGNTDVEVFTFGTSPAVSASVHPVTVNAGVALPRAYIQNLRTRLNEAYPATVLGVADALHAPFYTLDGGGNVTTVTDPISGLTLTASGTGITIVDDGSGYKYFDIPAGVSLVGASGLNFNQGHFLHFVAEAPQANSGGTRRVAGFRNAGSTHWHALDTGTGNWRDYSSLDAAEHDTAFARSGRRGFVITRRDSGGGFYVDFTSVAFHGTGSSALLASSVTDPALLFFGGEGAIRLFGFALIKNELQAPYDQYANREMFPGWNAS